MKSNKKQYWKGLEQLKNDPEFVKYADKEFPEYLPTNENSEGGSSRRDFLKMMGFGLAAASLAACEAPVRKAIPYLNKPVDVDPGIPNYYASTFMNGGDYCSVVVKTREGRPIKVEGNSKSPISKGKTSARVEASVLSLYDQERLTDPQIGDQKVSWQDLDNQVKTKLESIASSGGQTRIVTKTIISPSTKAALAAFQERYPNIEVVTYDAISVSGMLRANEMTFGKRALPTYHFDKAKTIVSFSADFIGTWINPTQFAADFAKTRKVKAEKLDMSRLFVIESNLSLTGANADYRLPVKPSKEGLIVADLYNAVASKAGAATLGTPKSGNEAFVKRMAEDLWNAKGSSLVVSGSNDTAIQVIVNAINDLLGAYGNTVDMNVSAYYKQGDDEAMTKFVNDLSAGQIDGVIFYNCNPVYDHPLGSKIKEGIGKANLKLSTSERLDETASLAEYIAPDNHYLESWNDAMPVDGHYSLAQPTIRNLFNTRQAQDSFLNWAGVKESYYDFIRNYWQENIFAQQSSELLFDTFWDKCLYDGVYQLSFENPGAVSFQADISTAGAAIGRRYKNDNQEMELVMYEKIGLGDGSEANNPWLQEMPDPISKACWDNYLTVSQKWAAGNGVTMVESKTVLATLTVGDQSIKLPVLVQPGQAEGTMGLAIGYGREKAGKVANGVGVNAYPFMTMDKGTAYMIANNVKVEVSGESYQIAQTQTHHTFMNREFVVQEGTLSEYKEDPSSVTHHPRIAASNALEEKLGETTIDGFVRPGVVSLWEGHAYPNHHWAMAIDLNSCTGCGACTISCQAENNVPVVGREEVLNRREMHWIRIDRYYSSPESADSMADLEKAADNPEVTFMPMLCQQCNNAPCETVCPVAATTHSTEGLNQMTYNRCIGTRYCANNCPYKVRRFNWFKYHDNEKFADNTSMNNDLGKMVLNPDVTVRSRGVMEKCTFCVQRIQYGKLEAKKDGRRPDDGDINTACASACPSEAIVFGDLKNPDSKVSQMLKFEDKGDYQEVKEERAYHVLEEINVKPNIWYFTKIRNKEENLA